MRFDEFAERHTKEVNPCWFDSIRRCADEIARRVGDKKTLDSTAYGFFEQIKWGDELSVPWDYRWVFVGEVMELVVKATGINYKLHGRLYSGRRH